MCFPFFSFFVTISFLVSLIDASTVFAETGFTASVNRRSEHVNTVSLCLLLYNGKGDSFQVVFLFFEGKQKS